MRLLTEIPYTDHLKYKRHNDLTPPIPPTAMKADNINLPYSYAPLLCLPTPPITPTHPSFSLKAARTTNQQTAKLDLGTLQILHPTDQHRARPSTVVAGPRLVLTVRVVVADPAVAARGEAGQVAVLVAALRVGEAGLAVGVGVRPDFPCLGDGGEGEGEGGEEEEEEEHFRGTC